MGVWSILTTNPYLSTTPNNWKAYSPHLKGKSLLPRTIFISLFVFPGQLVCGRVLQYDIQFSNDCPSNIRSSGLISEWLWKKVGLGISFSIPPFLSNHGLILPNFFYWKFSLYSSESINVQFTLRMLRVYILFNILEL